MPNQGFHLTPQSVKDLWTNTLRYNHNDNEDTLVQNVSGHYKKNRMIVYIVGTASDDFNQVWWENTYARVGITKSDQVAGVNAALEYCADNSSYGSIDEIMLAIARLESKRRI